MIELSDSLQTTGAAVSGNTAIPAQGIKSKRFAEARNRVKTGKAASSGGDAQARLSHDADEAVSRFKNADAGEVAAAILGETGTGSKNKHLQKKATRLVAKAQKDPSVLNVGEIKAVQNGNIGKLQSGGATDALGQSAEGGYEAKTGTVLVSQSLLAAGKGTELQKTVDEESVGEPLAHYVADKLGLEYPEGDPGNRVARVLEGESAQHAIAAERKDRGKTTAHALIGGKKTIVSAKNLATKSTKAQKDTLATTRAVTAAIGPDAVNTKGAESIRRLAEASKEAAANWDTMSPTERANATIKITDQARASVYGINELLTADGFKGLNGIIGATGNGDGLPELVQTFLTPLIEAKILTAPNVATFGFAKRPEIISKPTLASIKYISGVADKMQKLTDKIKSGSADEIRTAVYNIRKEGKLLVDYHGLTGDVLDSIDNFIEKDMIREEQFAAMSTKLTAIDDLNKELTGTLNADGTVDAAKFKAVSGKLGNAAADLETVRQTFNRANEDARNAYINLIDSALNAKTDDGDYALAKSVVSKGINGFSDEYKAGKAISTTTDAAVRNAKLVAATVAKDSLTAVDANQLVKDVESVRSSRTALFENDLKDTKVSKFISNYAGEYVGLGLALNYGLGLGVLGTQLALDAKDENTVFGAAIKAKDYPLAAIYVVAAIGQELTGLPFQTVLDVLLDPNPPTNFQKDVIDAAFDRNSFKPTGNPEKDKKAAFLKAIGFSVDVATGTLKYGIGKAGKETGSTLLGDQNHRPKTKAGGDNRLSGIF